MRLDMNTKIFEAEQFKGASEGEAEDRVKKYDEGKKHFLALIHDVSTSDVNRFEIRDVRAHTNGGAWEVAIEAEDTNSDSQIWILSIEDAEHLIEILRQKVGHAGPPGEIE